LLIRGRNYLRITSRLSCHAAGIFSPVFGRFPEGMTREVIFGLPFSKNLHKFRINSCGERMIPVFGHPEASGPRNDMKE
jgi:hypothetical protein